MKDVKLDLSSLMGFKTLQEKQRSKLKSISSSAAVGDTKNTISAIGAKIGGKFGVKRTL